VYASTYYKGPKAFSKRVGHRTEEEQMAVIIQKLVGSQYGDSFYPAISGGGQSHNYYPFARMKPEEGIVTLAMGLGKTVVEGEKTLRFSPAHPQLLPQRSTVEDILENAQRSIFMRLKWNGPAIIWIPTIAQNLWHREVKARLKTSCPCSSSIEHLRTGRASHSRYRSYARVSACSPLPTFSNTVNFPWPISWQGNARAWESKAWAVR
jgi:hypothetical protein